MKFKPAVFLSLSAIAFLMACNNQGEKKEQATNPIIGTWQLVSGATITKGHTQAYPKEKDQQMIKVINETHFAFLNHVMNAAKDSSNKFDAGGGRYTLKGDQYTEHLDYYKDKAWEGKPFTFTVTFNGDTLVQKGIEKVEGTGIDRVIIEKYLKVK
ncbi:hypothetical protein [Mucilaginibacter sp.]|uniref:hypothetical protein n=1 Tax=Mucilaginibacter sp. TaxID=1882438 RepID=UPI00260A2F63|nr:hypothetical protein [Mucilaginibacter sp.]MDB4920727.1 hypothetical protein [Mucilaginibacter sp.]